MLVVSKSLQICQNPIISHTCVTSFILLTLFSPLKRLWCNPYRVIEMTFKRLKWIFEATLALVLGYVLYHGFSSINSELRDLRLYSHRAELESQRRDDAHSKKVKVLRATIGGLEKSLRVRSAQQLAASAKIKVLNCILSSQQKKLTSLEEELKSSQQNTVEAVSTKETYVSKQALANLKKELLESQIVGYKALVKAVKEDIGSMKETLSLEKRAEMCEKILSPTVQINCDEEVGSGTIIYSKPNEKGDYDTYVLTAHHVVSGVIEVPEDESEEDDEKPEIELKSYWPDNKEHKVTVVAYNKKIDTALLKIDSKEKFEYIAEIISRKDLEEITVFTPVCAAGCPLGYPPLPTKGELTAKNIDVNGQNFWMISAPTIFGNSGGGIYLFGKNELVGVLSRVSAYNNLVNIAVCHMGIMITAEDICNWLDKEGFSYLYQEPAAPVQAKAKESKGLSLKGAIEVNRIPVAASKK